jgi:cell division protein FtsB
MTPEEYGILRTLEKKNDELEAQIKRMKDDAKAWAAEQIIAMESRREYFRTMYCDNCENYKSEKCSTCFSHGFTYPVQYSPGPHMLFRTPHPKDVEIARLQALEKRVEELELAVERATANMIAAQNRAVELEKALRECEEQSCLQGPCWEEIGAIVKKALGVKG